MEEALHDRDSAAPCIDQAASAITKKQIKDFLSYPGPNEVCMKLADAVLTAFSKKSGWDSWKKTAGTDIQGFVD